MKAYSLTFLFEQDVKFEIPRNSSIENFWMLVDMGDLPEPDTGVLSENLFPPSSSSSAPASSSSSSFSSSSSPSSSSAVENPPPLSSSHADKAGKSSTSNVVDSSSLGLSLKALSPPSLSLNANPSLNSSGNGSSSYRGLLSSVDGTSHMYNPRAWAANDVAATASDLHAINALAPSGETNAENRGLAGGGLPTLQGGGSLLQNMNGKKETKDYSLVTGLPKTIVTSSSSSQKSPALPSAILSSSPPTAVGSLRQSSSAGNLKPRTGASNYHPFPPEDVRTLTQEALPSRLKVDDAGGVSGKRKHEDMYD